jgi:hypothetical protein
MMGAQPVVPLPWPVRTTLNEKLKRKHVSGIRGNSPSFGSVRIFVHLFQQLSHPHFPIGPSMVGLLSPTLVFCMRVVLGYWVI